MANGNAGQLYIDWLYSYFRQLYMSGDETYGDPTTGATTGILWGKQPTMAITLLNEAADLVDAGAWGSNREFSLPFVNEFYNAMGSYQKIHPGEATALDKEGARADIDYTLARIEELQNQGQLTQRDMAELNLATQRLNFDMQQAGFANQMDVANLETMRQRYYNEFYTAQQQTALQGAEWFAGLQAQPKNWIERWYAEHQPFGAEMPEGLGGAAYPEWLKPQQYQMPQPYQMPQMPQYQPQQYQQPYTQPYIPPVVPPVIPQEIEQVIEEGTAQGWLSGPPLSSEPVGNIALALNQANPELGMDWASQRAMEIKYGVGKPSTAQIGEYNPAWLAPVTQENIEAGVSTVLPPENLVSWAWPDYKGEYAAYVQQRAQEQAQAQAIAQAQAQAQAVAQAQAQIQAQVEATAQMYAQIQAQAQALSWKPGGFGVTPAPTPQPMPQPTPITYSPVAAQQTTVPQAWSPAYTLGNEPWGQF